MKIKEIQQKIAKALNGVEALIQGGCVTTTFYNHPYGNYSHPQSEARQEKMGALHALQIRKWREKKN